MRKALNSIFAVVTVRKGDGGFRIRTNKTTPRVSNIKGAIVRFKKKIKILTSTNVLENTAPYVEHEKGSFKQTHQHQSVLECVSVFTWASCHSFL